MRRHASLLSLAAFAAMGLGGMMAGTGPGPAALAASNGSSIKLAPSAGRGWSVAHDRRMAKKRRNQLKNRRAQR